MRSVSLPERAGRAVVTGALVLFAVWTLVYQVALLTGLPATPTLGVTAVLGVAALVGLSRLPGEGRREAPGWPGSRASLAVVAVAVVATVLALTGLRLAALALGVVAALVGLALSSQWAPHLHAERLTRALHVPEPVAPTADDATPEADGGGSGRALWWCGWGAGVVSGVLAMFIASPDSDDVYFVNLSTWVAERGRFPLHDTMVSSDVFPAVSAHTPPIHSVEGLFGAVAGLLGLEAGTVTYVIVPPLACVLGLLVLTLLVAEAGVPAAPVALLATTVYLWTAGRSGYGVSGFFAMRIWQGKAMLVSIAMPLAFLYGTRLIRTRSVRAHALFAAAVVACVGLSNSAVFLVPVLVAGLVLAAIAMGEWRGALRVAVWTIYPAAMGVLSRMLAPVGATREQLVGEGFPVGLPSGVIDPLMTVPGYTGMLAVTALAIGVGALGIGNRAMRLGAAGAVVAAGLTLLPPLRGALEQLGLTSVLWRMWWVIPITVLLAGTVGATAHWVRGRRLAPLAIGAAVALIALVPLVAGRWVGSPVNDARFVPPTAWKLPLQSFSGAKLVESISEPGDVVLVPARTARGLVVLTVDVKPVSARPSYLPIYASTPAAHAGERLVLQQFVDVTTPKDPSRIATALDVLDVRTVCLRNHRGGGIRLLEGLGWERVARKHGITCLQD